LVTINENPMEARMVLSDKYMAGFFDADGSLMARARIDSRPDMVVEVAQRALYREIPESYAAAFGGIARERTITGGQYVDFAARGRMARKAVERLKGYLICKGDFAAGMLKLVDEASILRTEEDVRGFRAQVSALRKQVNTSTANFPPRKWLAGYFDGDGGFSVKVCPKTGYAYPTAAILAAPAYKVGLDLIANAFGGSVCQTGDNFLWQLQLSQPSKAKEFLDYFAQHLIIKKAQAYFLLGCAVGGNFRDGNAIREHIKALNSHQHRLSDPAGHAAEMLRQVQFDIPKRRQGRPPGVIELRPRAPKRQSALRLM
jgi:hypothetical protein